MGMQGTPSGMAMSGTAMPMPSMMKKGGSGMMMMKKGGSGMMMMKKGGSGMMMMKKGGRSRKMRGGMAYGGPLSPHSYNGQGVGTSGAGLQIMATTMN